MYINTYRNGRGNYPPTAIALADALGWEIINRTNLDSVREPVVNWGMNVTNPYDSYRGRVLNIKAPIDKATAFRKLSENNVSTPRYLLGPVVRRRLRHMQGRDIVRYDGNRYFFVEEIPKAKEYRVECFRGTDGVMAAFRGHIKLPVPGNTEFNWNRNNTTWDSHGYRTIREALGDSTLSLAKRAVEALGYDFGAVDIIEDGSGGQYVLEVNSAPHLEEVGLSKYVWRINRWINSLS